MKSSYGVSPKYYLMIFHDYDLDPEMEGPFPTPGDRTTQAVKMCEDRFSDEAGFPRRPVGVYIADVGVDGQLSIHTFQCPYKGE